MRKFKFTEPAICYVWKINSDVRSVSISVLGGPGGRKPVGKVTIPVNYEVPDEGDLIEVRYLYAYPEGALYQPVYKGPRPDKISPDTYTSLKFKQGTEEDS